MLHNLRLMCLQVADDEYEGMYTVTVEHSFDSGNYKQHKITALSGLTSKISWHFTSAR